MYVTAKSVEIVLHCARCRPGYYPQHSTTIQKWCIYVIPSISAWYLHIPGQGTGRDKGASKEYTFRNTTRLRPPKVMLTVTRNKVQLIDLMCEDTAFHKDYVSQHKLVLTGSGHVQLEINRGVIIKCHDMKTTQEETRYHDCSTSGRGEGNESACGCRRHWYSCSSASLLLPRWYSSFNLCSDGITIRGHAVIDINATVDLHRDIIPDLLAAHGLTGCDTVATYLGIWKAAALE